MIVRSVPGAGSRVALTFDDGPCVPSTAAILDAFGERGARATFFVRGGALDGETSPLVLRARAEGHEIGNHTERHLRFDAAGEETIRSEIVATHARLAGLLGAPPAVLRPPYGAELERVDAVAAALGYRATVGWNVLADDWLSPPPDVIVERLLADEALLPGGIVLLHDGVSPTRLGESRAATVAAVRALLPRLAALGIEPVTVSELLDAGGLPAG